MAIDDHGKHRPVSDMIHQRVGDYDAFKEYQRRVFDRTEAYLADLDPADFGRVVVERPFPPLVSETYSARVAGPEGITVLDGFECWLYQHGLRTFSWQADDPNGDALLFDVAYRALGDETWRPLRSGLSEPVFAWDTATVPSGRYQVRITASDAAANPHALALTTSRETPSTVTVPCNVSASPSSGSATAISWRQRNRSSAAMALREQSSASASFVSAQPSLSSSGSWPSAMPSPSLSPRTTPPQVGVTQASTCRSSKALSLKLAPRSP